MTLQEYKRNSVEGISLHNWSPVIVSPRPMRNNSVEQFFKCWLSNKDDRLTNFAGNQIGSVWRLGDLTPPALVLVATPSAEWGLAPTVNFVHRIMQSWNACKTFQVWWFHHCSDYLELTRPSFKDSPVRVVFPSIPHTWSQMCYKSSLVTAYGLGLTGAGYNQTNHVVSRVTW